MFPEIRDRLRRLYLEDPRPWLVGFSGGKDSTLLAALIFEVVAAIPAADRRKPIAVLCTDTRVEIPALTSSSTASAAGDIVLRTLAKFAALHV